MRIKQVITSFIGAAVVLAGGPSLADTATVPSLPSAGGISITPLIGTDFTVGGDFVKRGSETISNSSVFGSSVTGTTTFAVEGQRFDDVYGRPLVLEVSGNYGLSNQDEALATLRYMRADGKSFDALSATSSGTIGGVAFSANAVFQGEMDNYEEYGLDLAYRHFFDTSSGFHPYLGGLVGATRNNSVSVDLSYSGTPIINGLRFYDSGWNYAVGLEAGFRYDLSPSVAAGIETGIRYSGNLRTDRTDINSASAGGLSNVNDGGSRWDIPLTAGLTLRF